jgi:plastocyanin
MLPRITVVLMGLVLVFPVMGLATIHDISIQSFDFTPGNQTITAGDSVRWTNNDGVPHTSTSDAAIWTSGTLSPGQSYMRAFTSAGTFPYHCAIHISMKDTLTVVPPATFDLQIDIGDFFFNPPAVQIAVGQTIRWLNNGTMDHTSSADNHTWDSGTLSPGQFFDFTFTAEGAYPYHCFFHSGMTGTVIVGKPDSITQDIQIVDFAFSPPSAEVTIGQYVRWINLGSMPHTSTDTTAGHWDSGNLNPGDTYTLRTDSAGTYHYICSYHSGMAGMLRVAPVIDQTVEIFDNFFSPAVIQIQLGQSIRWMNMGIRTHTSTSDTGIWDSDSIFAGNHFDFTFPSEGVYHYHCNMHPLIMHGTVIVGRPDSVVSDIQIVDNAFNPAVATIIMGQNIRWINFGTHQHSSTDTSANHWDSGTLNPGDVFTLHADSAGIYHYMCNFHLGMAGTLTVTDTASGSCHYVIGDINGSGVANGIDVVYGVGYFKGGPVPPITCDCPPHGILYPGGDVNGNCVFNGIDITYFVSYLKGGAALTPCPSCLPSAPPVNSR